MPHIHASVNRVTIGSDNVLSPIRRQAIIWTNARLLSIGLLGTNLSKISIKIRSFSLKMRLEISSNKVAAILSGRDELNRFIENNYSADRYQQSTCNYILVPLHRIIFPRDIFPATGESMFTIIIPNNHSALIEKHAYPFKGCLTLINWTATDINTNGDWSLGNALPWKLSILPEKLFISCTLYQNAPFGYFKSVKSPC